MIRICRRAPRPASALPSAAAGSVLRTVAHRAAGGEQDNEPGWNANDEAHRSPRAELSGLKAGDRPQRDGHGIARRLIHAAHAVGVDAWVEHGDCSRTRGCQLR